MAATPTRIDTDIFDSAKVAGQTMSRSAAQQVNHWARIGRALEFSPEIRHTDIARVLAGQASYDDLPREEQAVVRAEWDERILELRTGLNLSEQFTAAGRSWTEADADGNLVVKVADEAS